MRFVDTNVLLYASSALVEDANKRLRALELLREATWHYRYRSSKSSTISQPVPAVTLE